MQLRFFEYPECLGLRKDYVSWVFTDICTSLAGAFGLALTTCNENGKGNLEVTVFGGGPAAYPPLCNSSALFRLAAPGPGVCSPAPPGAMGVSFMLGDESEQIQCASTATQGAYHVSLFPETSECDLLKYSIRWTVPTTGESGCSPNAYDVSSAGNFGSAVRSVLNETDNTVSLSIFNSDHDCSAPLFASWNSMAQNGTCYAADGGLYHGALTGARPCAKFPPTT
jgi:hypothetical protein